MRPFRGVIPAAIACSKAGRTLAVPQACAELAARVPHCRVLAAADLLSLCAHLRGNLALPVAVAQRPPTPAAGPDMADVCGQAGARRALEIAAAGGHNLLLCGPPGTGKTMLASRLPGILPAPEAAAMLSVLALHNLAGCDDPHAQARPFRAPHHSASAAAIVGGGSDPRPGEISLAHGGVLFLDELPEFARHTLDMLREPLESGVITLSRARRKLTYPAHFQLVAAMNPCACGYAGDSQHRCRCTPDQIQRYRQRISGPLLDRIDLHLQVARPPSQQLLYAQAPGEPSAAIRARVERAHARQLRRQGCSNSALSNSLLVEKCALSQEARGVLEQAIDSLHLSARGAHRCLRVARTVADMAGAATIDRVHIGEALSYRQRDLMAEQP